MEEITCTKCGFKDPPKDGFVQTQIGLGVDDINYETTGGKNFLEVLKKMKGLKSIMELSENNPICLSPHLMYN